MNFSAIAGNAWDLHTIYFTTFQFWEKATHEKYTYNLLKFASLINTHTHTNMNVAFKLGQVSFIWYLNVSCYPKIKIISQIKNKEIMIIERKRAEV